MAELHNKTLAEGIFMDILNIDDATLLYSNAANIKLLVVQLQHDIMQHQYDI